ncbi:molybdenum cofactor guanylyltransferase [Desulfothermus okinawensis JCM 13304]
MDVTAVVLCGGKSSRMGYKNKCFFKLGNSSFIEIITDKLSIFFDNILLVAKDPQKYTSLGYKVVSDIYEESSSLTGIHAGLVFAPTKYSFIVGCDTPLIKLELINYLISTLDKDYQVVVPKIGKYFEPLCGFYSKECIPIIEDMITKKCFRISTLFSKVKVKTIDEFHIKKHDPDLHSFFNINTKEDYKKALKIYFNIV